MGEVAGVQENDFRMTAALRGLSAMVQNQDGTYSITYDPTTAGDLPETTTLQIGGGYVGQQLTGSSASGYQGVSENANVPITCASNQAMYQGSCVAATFGVPNSVWLIIGAAFAAAMMFGGRR